MKVVITMLMCLLLSAPAFADKAEDRVIDNAMIDVLIHKKESVQLLNPYQIKVYAYQIGAKVDLGETLRAITFLESRFGQAGRVGDNNVARGITQIQRPTAKFILNRLMGFTHKFSDNEIDKLLTSNDKLCIIMSKCYLVYLMDKFKNKPANWSTGLLSYNVGPGNATKHGTDYDPNNYLHKAKKFINQERGS